MPKQINVSSNVASKRIVKTRPFVDAAIYTKADYAPHYAHIAAIVPGDTMPTGTHLARFGYNVPLRVPANPFFPVSVPVDNARDFVPVDSVMPEYKLSGDGLLVSEPERSVAIANDAGFINPEHFAAITITTTLPPQATQPAATSDVADLTEKRLAREAAKKAVREFYGAGRDNASLPFKAAVDLKYRAAINFARFTPGTITGTHRTAAALAAIIAYCDVNPDGTFVRGSGSVPRRMLGLRDNPDGILKAGIESGVLSRLIGTGAISYVSGPTHGDGAETAIFKINKPKARANMLAHNEKLASGEHRFSRVLALLES